MKLSLSLFRKLLLSFGLFIVIAFGSRADGPYSVTTPGGNFFAVNGQSPNPTITAKAGDITTFNITNSSIHPLIIQTAPDRNVANRYSGASTTIPKSLGTLTVTIPTQGFPTTLYYVCNNHG